MKVLFCASEAAPLVKVGGLADVVGGLPKALSKLGVDVAIAIPKYEEIQLTESSGGTWQINVEYAGKTEKVLVYETKLPDTDPSTSLGTSIPVYLFENQTYLSTGPVYSAKSAEGSPLDIDRFSFFSKAVVEFLNSQSAMRNPQFDIVHCHDWHTAWIPFLLKQENLPIKTLLTIHNLGKQYQGRTSREVVEKLGIGEDLRLDARNLKLDFEDRSWKLEKKNLTSTFQPQDLASSLQPQASNDVNILLQGVLHADLLTTVSPTYCQEIQTPEFGGGLDESLRQRQNDLFGILNGIDDEVWNPETDKYLTTNYGLTDWQEGKSRNKIRLLQTVGLPMGENIPVFAMVTRIAEQKGFEILIPALETLFSTPHVIILGVGDPKIETSLKTLEQKFPDQLKFITRFDEALAHLIYAGSDFFLMPSKFEPCGITQMIAMRYGTLPIVRKVGGLSDSVIEGVNGFVFEEYSSGALLNKINEAVKLKMEELKQDYEKMVSTAMSSDFSWDKSAKKYLELYQRLM